jgi:hypothetical protein
MNSFKKTSKAGLLGALIGGAAASRFNKPQDSVQDKVMRVGVGGIIGFLLGSFVEKKVRERKK